MYALVIALSIFGFFIHGSVVVADCDCGSSKSGPGFSSPQEAIKQAKREKILYVPCISLNPANPDYLSVVDADPSSPNYSTVISRLYFPVQKVKDELHHSGWNTCSACHDDKTAVRNKLLFPCLNSDRVYIVDTSDERQPQHYKTIEPEELHNLGLSSPHTTHCIPTGEVMISTMGDGLAGNGQGQFLMIDGKKNFTVKGKYSNVNTPYGYDFWYQPYFDVMISSEWGAPQKFKGGINLDDLAKFYGHTIHVWSWDRREYVKPIDLGTDNGWLPLETRFLHDPYKPHGYVACALSSTVFHINKKSGDWKADLVITVPPKKVENWWMGLADMPGVITDILISMDDQFLYFSNWVHGDIRQYDISNPAAPKLVGQVFIGGSIVKGGPVNVVHDTELTSQPDPLYVKGVRIEGGPQMLQLSIDGKRLYVTTSLFSAWDKQFYPELYKKGACLLQIDVNNKKGGMKVNKNFLVNYGNEPKGPALAHEIRWPGIDCSSDIFSPKGRWNDNL
ncbi:methanethiol oxidase-like [Bradysia coprophila]|uniref:methanethiol oxidase-like n=1 Tax=Bradysia coprophila TaxID=38358 RepID=UPI00187D8FA8|nr:methanethiol oxidase-like [Bradysia coprophila]